ncbi:MAG: NAD(P)H-hydrate dehydratase [Clostridia bacterium]|nr:NAD(P)H-hydrate dehydratase [Clostridia bacterium]
MNLFFADEEYIRSLIKPRKRDSNKGDFGTLAMLCGSRYMTGAAKLAALGALRSGVGLVKFFGSDGMIDRMQSMLAEPVFADISTFSEAKYSAFLCGCGIGREYDSVLPEVLRSCRTHAVLDADCINFLAAHKDLLKEISGGATLTPHPGEMSRLCGKSIEEIQSDRVRTALGFAEEYGCITVLKGYKTVIASPDGRVCVNGTGNSGLAKGGSGDVRAGVTASLNAQGYSPFEAACIAVYLHGLAGDRLSARMGESGVIPSDLPGEIGLLLG